MEFLILGPLEVLDEGRSIPLGGAKQQAALAILLLHRNKVVSRDRLIDGLWGETPPPSAAHTLETYISRLRKALHDERAERLLTRQPGYLLRLDDGESDLQRLELLTEQARRALASDDPVTAARNLKEGLALFRGEPLEGFAYFPFAQAEARRLDELRLAVVEQRIDVELAQGRHADLVGELESLVARYPLRERFSAQLMLALYRSGRQGEALATFDRVRRELADEFGVDPGQALRQILQRILRQDPLLEPTYLAPVAVDGRTSEEAAIDGLAHKRRLGGRITRSGHRSWRRPRVIVTGVAVSVLVTLVAVLGTVQLGSGRPSAPAGFSPGMAIVDAKTGERTAVILPSTLGTTGNYTFADGHFWTMAGDPDRFVEIDPRSGAVLRRITPTSKVDAYAVDGNDLWEVGDSTLAQIDTGLGVEVARYPLSEDPDSPGGQTGVALANGSLWVTRGGSDEVLKVDPETGHVVRRYVGVPNAVTIAVDAGSAWIISNFTGATVLDLATGDVVRVSIPIGPLQYVAAGGGYGWVSDESKGVVYKIDRVGDVAATYQTGQGARPMSYADGVLWVANQDVGTVTGIDAVTGITRTVSFGHPTSDIAAGGGRVLVGVAPGRTYEDQIDLLQGRVVKLLVQPYQLADNDPALDSTWLAFQVEYATCARLLNYPDVDGARGATLRPEIATSMPVVSEDGLTFTFTIRPGYRFSPPSNQALTAETFRYSIERALSPRMPRDAPGPRFIGDIVGEAAFREGEAEHISGISATSDTLAITLVRPSADFLQRLSLPFFCPVPIGSPIGVPDVGAVMSTHGGELTIPSAGPYYIADFNTGEYMILRRNPNYRGPRPHPLDAIALREGINPGQAVARVEQGSWDGIVNLYDPILDPTGELAAMWGPGSPEAVVGDQRYFSVPMPVMGVFPFHAYQANGQFLSPRLGCRVFPPFGYGLDLAALCVTS